MTSDIEVFYEHGIYSRVQEVHESFSCRKKRKLFLSGCFGAEAMALMLLPRTRLELS